MAATIIYSPEADRLELRIAPKMARAAMVVLAGLSILFFVQGTNLVWAGLLGMGSVVLWFVPETEVVLDRGRERFRFVRRFLLQPAKEIELPWQELEDIRMEEHRDSDGDPSYRAVLILRDGRAQPVTNVWSVEHREHALALRSFFHQHELQPRPALNGGVLFLALLAIGLAGFGFGYAIFQEQRLAKAKPVNAKLLEARVERTEDDDTVTYVPHVKFAFEHMGRTREGTNVLPAGSWNEPALINGLRPGQDVTAYVDPDDPSEAFLLHHRNPIPFITLGVGLVLCAGIGPRTRWKTRSHGS